MIRAENLIKEYKNGDETLQVLKQLNFVIGDGEFVAVIGPSGAGKSTLLYQISLLDEPTSGKVFLDNQDTGNLSNNKKTSLRLMKLGYVFQDYALLPELTAIENVALPLIMQGMPKRSSMELARKALDRLGLSDKYSFVPSKLSGGQQQRVSISRAIAHKPKILFADEPTANLDSENSLVVMQAFVDLHHSGQTIVMVTHEPEYARMAKRIITLRDGSIESDISQ